MVARVIKQKTQFRNRPVGINKFDSVDAGKSQSIIGLAGRAQQIINTEMDELRTAEAKTDALAIKAKDLLTEYDDKGNLISANTDHLIGKGSVYSKAFKENVLSNQYDEIERQITTKFNQLSVANKMIPNGVANFEKQASDFLLEFSKGLEGNLEVFAGNSGAQKLLDTSATLQNSRAARTYELTNRKAYEGLQGQLSLLMSHAREGKISKGEFATSDDPNIQAMLTAANGINERLDRLEETTYSRQANIEVQKFKGNLAILGLKKLTSSLTNSEQLLVNKFLNNEDNVQVEDLIEFVPKELHADLKTFMSVDDTPYRNQAINDISQTYTGARIATAEEQTEQRIQDKIYETSQIDELRSELTSFYEEKYLTETRSNFNNEEILNGYLENFKQSLNNIPNISDERKQTILDNEIAQAPTLIAKMTINKLMINQTISKNLKKDMSLWLLNGDDSALARIEAEQSKNIAMLTDSSGEVNEDVLSDARDRSILISRTVNYLKDYKKENVTSDSYTKTFLNAVQGLKDYHAAESKADRDARLFKQIHLEISNNQNDTALQQQHTNITKDVLNATQSSLILLDEEQIQGLLQNIDKNHTLSENNMELINQFITNPTRFAQMATGQGANPEQALLQMSSILKTLHGLPNTESGKPQGESLLHKINNKEWKDLSPQIERVTSLFGALNAYGNPTAMIEIINNVKEGNYRGATVKAFGTKTTAQVIAANIDRSKYPETEIQVEYDEFFDAMVYTIDKQFRTTGNYADEESLNEAVQEKALEVFANKIELDYKPPHEFQTDLNGAYRASKYGPLMRNSLDVLLPEGDPKREEFFRKISLELATVNAPNDIPNVTTQIKYSFDYDREIDEWKADGNEEKLFPYKKARLLTFSAFGADPIFIAIDEDGEQINWKPNADAEEEVLMWTVKEVDTPVDTEQGESLEDFTLRKTEAEFKELMTEKVADKKNPESKLMENTRRKLGIGVTE